jgi:hypothetical protein
MLLIANFLRFISYFLNSNTFFVDKDKKKTIMPTLEAMVDKLVYILWNFEGILLSRYIQISTIFFNWGILDILTKKEKKKQSQIKRKKFLKYRHRKFLNFENMITKESTRTYWGVIKVSPKL